jgi:predicted ATPase/DNA-binding CsgD family transcriptional regulator
MVPMSERSAVSGREAEVLALVAEHLSNAQIAHRLRISIRTVEHHVSALLRKYHVPDRRQLASLAHVAQGQPEPGPLAGIPVSHTSFIGRSHELDAALLLLSQARLVTLVGPGGVGKTRLAAAIAEASGPAFPFGGAFVDLVPVRDKAVAQAAASVLGVTEVPQQSLADAIVARLGRGRSLLVLDNCEHMLDAVSAFIHRVLASCPDTSILATGRERLGVPGERALPVGPLPMASDAEQLFTDRALAVDPGFTAAPSVIAELCGRLDGMPLAIELAAARSAAMGATGLLAALDDYLRVLVGGRDQDHRHRSLRTVIDWSHALLDEDDRTLFRRLAVFVGAFDLPAAVAVAGAGDRATVADLLGRLTDKNLVVRAGGPVSRWRLLATIRAYATEQLDGSGDDPGVRRRHLWWAAETAAALAARLTDSRLTDSRLSESWRDDFDAVADDLRAALAGAPTEPDAAAHALARSLARLSYARRFLTEALEHYRHAAGHAVDDAEAAADLRVASEAVFSFGHASQAFELLLASAERARAAGDGNATAIALARAVETATRLPSGFTEEVPYERIRELYEAAVTAGDPDDPLVAAHLAAAAAWSATSAKLSPDPDLATRAVEAARVTGNPVLVCAALDATCHLAAHAGRQREAYRIARERLAMLSNLDRTDPSTAAEILDIYHCVTTCALAAGDLAGTLSIARQIGSDDLLGSHPYRSTSKLIAPNVLMGRFDEALEAAETMWDGWQRAGAPVAAWMSPAVSAAALAHGLLGGDAEFRRWCERADRAAGRVANPAAYGRNNAAFAAFVRARVAVQNGGADDAERLVAEAFAHLPRGRYQEYARSAAAELAVVAGLPDADHYLTRAAPAAAENDWAAACLARARGRLHDDDTALAAAVEGWTRIGAAFERDYTAALPP